MKCVASKKGTTEGLRRDVDLRVFLNGRESRRRAKGERILLLLREMKRFGGIESFFEETRRDDGNALDECLKQLGTHYSKSTVISRQMRCS